MPAIYLGRAYADGFAIGSATRSGTFFPLARWTSRISHSRRSFPQNFWSRHAKNGTPKIACFSRSEGGAGATRGPRAGDREPARAGRGDQGNLARARREPQDGQALAKPRGLAVARTGQADAGSGPRSQPCVSRPSPGSRRRSTTGSCGCGSPIVSSGATSSSSRSATRAGSSCRPTAMRSWAHSSMVTSKPSVTSAATIDGRQRSPSAATTGA